MNPVVVRNVKIGEGMPKICVPVVGVTQESIVEEIRELCTSSSSFDLIEWRVDWFEHGYDIEMILETLKKIREAAADVPILFTFRTAQEGGEKRIENLEYQKINQAVAKSGLADLVDVELFRGDEVMRAVVEDAHNNGVKVVASSHEFQITPPKEELVSRLCQMKELGADIPKVAVMPNSEKDVLTLLGATVEMKNLHPDIPIITMSMKGLGMVSRLAGEVFGSALSFGAAKKASAPGQIAVEDLRTVLEIIHRNL